jgi:hypothetical protein
LDSAFPESEGYWALAQGPLTAGPASEAEPDIAIVRGKGNFISTHPTGAVLVVEISRSSLKYDRGIKASLYASIGVPDYGILDVEGRVLEVRRRPEEAASQRFGWGATKRF